MWFSCGCVYFFSYFGCIHIVQVRVGVELPNGGDVVDVTVSDPSIPKSMLEVLRSGDAVLERVKA